MAKVKRGPKPLYTPSTPYPVRKVDGVWYKMTPYHAIDKKLTAPMRRARGLKNDDEE